MLAVISLAQVKGKLILSRPDIFQNIVVCFPFQESIAYFSMAIICCIVQWCPLAMVLSIDIRRVLEQHHKCIEASLLACKVKRCALEFVLPL